MALRWAGRNGGKTGIVVAADLIQRARDGDEQAFRELVGPYQRKLQVHCYRILGSLADAGDALRKPFLLPGRIWLRISRCACGPRLP
jgi:hypothetical protein